MKDLFGHEREKGGARRTDPHTSHEAAERINVNKLEHEAMRGLVNGPRSSATVAEYQGLPRDTFSPRMKPLEKKGMVYRHGKETCRNPSGRLSSMITWGLTPKGRAYLGLSPEPPSPSSSPAGASVQRHRDDAVIVGSYRSRRGGNSR